ncbi:cellulose biosynthesis cyclic di-GMP-binding regulatory protein BcsB [Oryzicola mucosus]|uniref:Cyclic di-GMP-binding protein n=1 Tax=Oryzicola mucosus TaxID=2767425 RepID=A0A8J6PNA5_9HYPH|nr:cellulose biosynthesis cyclic di-GMP-binding regulatory protein BcsB [Oryzicola mucosus]MBD0416586.1 cellulose biosynthesis cyclic di-GMP-binding regulatory protein BcsB [Oryzicola mucosus]
MKRLAFPLSLTLATLAATTGLAQQSPFDMTPEKPAQESVPAPASPPQTAPSVDDPAQQTTPPQTGAAGAARPAVNAARRYLLSQPDIVLSGENALRSWAMYLTPEQAASPAKLNFGYQNAIVIAPEASRLKLSINGVIIVDTPVESTESVSRAVFDIPAGLLRPGYNDVRIEASQRHRTDCTIQSTYELWSEINPEATYIDFSEPEAGRWQRVDDLRAIGTTPTSETRFNFVVPGADQAISTTPVMRLASGLGLMAEMPNQSFSISRKEAPPAGPGLATVVIGTAGELEPLLGELPPGAEISPTSLVVDDSRFGPSTLVVTGPNWPAVENAVEALITPLKRPTSQRATMSTHTWRMPDPPMVFQYSRLKFSDLGVNTQEFSGRRFRTNFAVSVPSDFFANAYGQATVLLDAAYTPDVMPGSHIDIYVNGNIAATVPITTGGGEFLSHLPIPVTMRHFQPGYNIIELEAVLLTENDNVCAPGATGSTERRFVLFDTSELVMPNFARIAQRPNLSALSGTGSPYGLDEAHIPVIVDRTQPEALSSAATLLARLSIAAGRPISMDASVAPSAIGAQNAISVSTISQVPAGMLRQVGMPESMKTSWTENTGAEAAGANTETTLDEWQTRLRGSSWRGQISSFEEWLQRTFNVSLDTFRIFQGAEPEFVPNPGENFLLAQQQNPTGTGVWTVITAPTARMLEEGMRAMASQPNWREVAGRVTTYNNMSTVIRVTQPQDVALFETQPFSMRNYRRIMANWLSANAVAYSMALVVMSVLLGTATLILLNTLGRKD